MSLRDWWIRLRSKPVNDVIRHKHRFVVMDTDTFKEKFSFQLSGINLFVTIGITVIILILLTTILIAFTPLREWIPGYTNSKMLEQSYDNTQRIDSLETAVENQEWLISTMQAIISGKNIDEQMKQMLADTTATLQQVADTYRHSKADSLLREEVGATTRALAANGGDMVLGGHRFIPPLHGNVVRKYDATSNHYGTDIAGITAQPVVASFRGTVVATHLTDDAGYVIIIQHPDNITTIYRNNSSLLKHQGDIVRTGEPIAIVVPAGKKPLMPYLHFEIWEDGQSVDPEDIIGL